MTAPPRRSLRNRRRCRPFFVLGGLAVAAAYALVLVGLHRAGREVARLTAGRFWDEGGRGGGGVFAHTRNGKADRSAAAAKAAGSRYGGPPRNCLDIDGPVPTILISRGRSGTGSMWQVLGALTGFETPSDEYTGASVGKSEAFFSNVGPTDGGGWVLDVMCHYQRAYRGSKTARARKKTGSGSGARAASLVGFKWKPYRQTFFTEASRNGLMLIADLASREKIGSGSGRGRSVKVVRSRRNPLDVLLSQTKHRDSGGKKKRKSEVAPHCMRGDEECVRKQLRAGTGVFLDAADLVRTLREATELENDVDAELRRLGVPFVETTFEATHGGGNAAAEEWMRIFRHLGVGPGEGLTAAVLRGAMRHVSTSHSNHNETIGNYEEVRRVLEGTDFERLLH